MNFFIVRAVGMTCFTKVVSQFALECNTFEFWHELGHLDWRDFLVVGFGEHDVELFQRAALGFRVKEVDDRNEQEVEDCKNDIDAIT